MGELRIKVRLGDSELELDGPTDAVERQFEPFRHLLMLKVGGETSPAAEKAAPVPAPEPPKPAVVYKLLSKVVSVRGPIYSLRVPAPIEDAILVILFAQRAYRQNENVSGSEIMEGLRQSGIQVSRADVFLKKFAREANIVISGVRRRRRYRLSSDGLQQAEAVVHHLAASIPDADPAQTTT